jgi:hypothetical protein
MNMDTIVTQEARLIILRQLAKESNQAMTSEAARRFLLDVFLIDRSREWVEEQFRYLREMGAVDVVKAESVQIARLTERGELHVEGKISIPGVQRRNMAGA